MKRWLLLAMLILLAASAIILHLPWGMPPPIPAIYQQGALIPLADAEKWLSAGRHKEALEAFRLAFLRTFREDQKGASERIRRRMASAGKELLEKGDEAGWPYLAASCVLSSDFSYFASVVEQWVLDTGMMRPTFSYPLMEPSGHRTLRGIRAVKVPFWLFKHLPPETDLEKWQGLLYNHMTEDLPDSIGSGYIWNFHLLFSTTTIPTFVEVHFAPSRDERFYVSFNNKIQWKKPLEQKSPGVLESIAGPPNLWAVDRMVVASRGRLSSMNVTLVREYTPLK